MHLLLTGASGYIGSRLLDMAAARGATVVVLGSVPSQYRDAERVRAFPWRLGQPIPVAALSGEPIDALIHLAHDWNAAEGADEPNRAGTIALRDTARRIGIPRFVYVSSLSARADALNRYGRIKASLEEVLTPPREVAARVGLVYGGRSSGLYATMLALTRLTPVLPMVDAGQLVQPIHLDEVCEGLLTLASRPELSGPVYGLASDRPLPFGDFLKLLARHAHQKSLLIVPFPRWLALLLADISARLPGPTVDRERILGLAGIRVRETANDLGALNLHLAPVEEGLAEPFRRQRLIREARTLLRYCAGGPVKASTIRHYVRDLERLGESTPLRLPGLAHRFPALVRLLDAAAPREALLRSRLGIAARVAEAGSEPPGHFHMTAPVSRFALVAQLCGLMMLEGCLLCLRLLRRKTRP